MFQYATRRDHFGWNDTRLHQHLERLYIPACNTNKYDVRRDVLEPLSAYRVIYFKKKTRGDEEAAGAADLASVVN